MKRGLLKQNSQILSILMRVFDVGILFVSSLAATKIKFGDFYPLHQSYLIVILITALVQLLVFSMSSIYMPFRQLSLFSAISKLFYSWCVVAFVMALFAFFTKTSVMFSREWMAEWTVITFLTMLSFRVCLIYTLRFFRSRGYNVKRLVIIGSGSLGRNVADEIKRSTYLGYKVVAILDDKLEYREKCDSDIPVEDIPSDLQNFLEQNQVDDVWITLPLRREKRIKEIMYMLRHTTHNVSLVPDIFGLDLLNHSMTDIAGIPVLNLRSSPMQGMSTVIKRVFDILFSFVALIFIFPLLLLISFLIKITSSGPVIFKQKRYGWDGAVINVYKFRSMISHKEKDGAITQARKDDKRVTPLGRFLRSSSLDELPQFWNVLQGRLSVVGPRPHAVCHNEEYKHVVSKYMLRHMVRPGITGWAQVSGWRGETDTIDKMQKRIECDLYYIENWSLWFDIKIIFLTLFKGFVNKNAY